MTTPKSKTVEVKPFWPELIHRSKYPTPHELRVARQPAKRHFTRETSPQPPPIPEGLKEEVSSVFIPPQDVYWIKDSLHNLRNEKADRVMLAAAVRTIEEKIDSLQEQVENSSHCKKQEEFDDLKEAVSSWRLFFRNTVAVGFLGGLVVLAGWLWQYFTLVEQVKQTSNSVSTTIQSVENLSTNYQSYKMETLENTLQTKALNDSKLVQLEYKLLSAMSQISRGQKVDVPKEPQPAGDTVNE